MPKHDARRPTELLPPCGAAFAGMLVAAAALLAPDAALDALAWQSGMATLLPAAQPPLGNTARALLVLGGGGGAAAIIWAALYLVWGADGFLATPREQGMRRADAHPDAPPRPPLTVTELAVGSPNGVTTPGVPVERALPTDLDLRLAAFDPGAVPSSPREPVRPVAPLARAPALVPGERIETFDLSPRGGDSGEPSIEQLLRRLESVTWRSARAG